MRGYLVTGIIKNNSIFLPYAGICKNDTISKNEFYEGYYMTNELCIGDNSKFNVFYINDTNKKIVQEKRFYGVSIRPVAEK